MVVGPIDFFPGFWPKGFPRLCDICEEGQVWFPVLGYLKVFPGFSAFKKEIATMRPKSVSRGNSGYPADPFQSGFVFAV